MPQYRHTRTKEPVRRSHHQYMLANRAHTPCRCLMQLSHLLSCSLLASAKCINGQGSRNSAVGEKDRTREMESEQVTDPYQDGLYFWVAGRIHEARAILLLQPASMN